MAISAELVGGPYDGLRVDLEPHQHQLHFPEHTFEPFAIAEEPVKQNPNLRQHTYIKGEERIRNRFRFYYKAPGQGVSS